MGLFGKYTVTLNEKTYNHLQQFLQEHPTLTWNELIELLIDEYHAHH